MFITVHTATALFRIPIVMYCWYTGRNREARTRHEPFLPYFFEPIIHYLDDWLTVHRSITLVDLQLDTQNSYLFTYNTFIKILYMFRALPCSSSGDLRRKCIYAASGIVTLCR